MNVKVTIKADAGLDIESIIQLVNKDRLENNEDKSIWDDLKNKFFVKVINSWIPGYVDSCYVQEVESGTEVN